MFQNIQTHKYTNRDQYKEDCELLYTNSLQYNGADSAITATARKMMEVMKEELNQVSPLTVATFQGGQIWSQSGSDWPQMG